MIDIVNTAHRSARSKGASTTASGSFINSMLAYLLMAGIALAPLPYGSIDPYYWLVAGAYIGALALVYAGFHIASGTALRTPLTAIPILPLLLAAFALFQIFQLLPIGSSVTTPGAQVLEFAQVSILPDATRMSLMTFMVFGLLFYLLMQAASNKVRRERLFTIILLIVLAYALSAILSLRLGDSILGQAKWAYIGSLTGPYVNQNSFATLLALGSIIALGKIAGLLARRWRHHPDDGPAQQNTSRILAFAVIYLGLLACILTTQSRMGLFSALAGGLAVVMLALRPKVKGLAWVAVFLSLATVLIVFGIVYGPTLLQRLGSLEQDHSVRSDLYQQVWEMILLRPWTGYGGGTFEFTYPLFHRPPVSPDLVWDRAHSTYLGLWSDFGLIAGTIPMAMIAVILWKLVGHVMTDTSGDSAASIGIGAIIVVASHSVFDFSLEIFANAMIFIAIIALAFASALGSKAYSRRGNAV